MLQQAAADYNISLRNSIMIGDSWRDIEAGNAAGCKTVLLNGTGTEAIQENNWKCSSMITANDLLSAVRSVLGLIEDAS